MSGLLLNYIGSTRTLIFNVSNLIFLIIVKFNITNVTFGANLLCYIGNLLKSDALFKLS